MEFTELVVRRYCVRAYQPDPVPEEKLQRVLEAACMAPTAANRQPFQLVVLHTEGRQEELKRMYHREWFVQAPLLIVACGFPRQAWMNSSGKSFADVDVAIVMDHLTLAAANEGLGTCWVAAFNVQAVVEILGLPEGVAPIVISPLGYAADEPQPKQRKPLAELVRYERW